ncbi:catechol 2,3-dioxygenase-like lactoylglutathione lyase family enzyme [Arthrobacter ginsengisoli]|uniref:Catechol 2,3-dioxygenase-like lactoylglutathione lyase family enzyme n=1 Tax=Arthrobacter ginsengisoli TaxID=1356565 RepID=A0ABU1UHN9_9MICC|nr:VOC family protein [Arthrobacter ginsengisoli]MDR7084717.1 catechol 2,3-dioxygenase-like lactoylglutathione lyase family enzyme [Arthrobacter ginsengisoli]
MSWRIHHVSLPARYVRETADFYNQILGMKENSPPWKAKERGDFPIDEQNVAWFDDGKTQLHLARHSGNFCIDNNFHIDPIVNGHVAIEVDDLDAVRERLRSRNIYFADPGNWALNGVEQIYVMDPASNAVEINCRPR